VQTMLAEVRQALQPDQHGYTFEAANNELAAF
jgi:hypothetical protein